MAAVSTNDVTTSTIADLAVTTAKLADDAVTTAKIADDAVTSDQIASGNTYDAGIYTGGVTLTTGGGAVTSIYEAYNTETFGTSIALTFGATKGNTRRITCTGGTNSTITATVPTAGYVLRLSLLSDATGGNVITFGTGFKSTGVYNLTASKYHNIMFVSDGSYLLEFSRTAAIT